MMFQRPWCISKLLPIRSVRHFGARRRRAVQNHPPSSSNLAFALLKPTDPNDGSSSLANMLNPFKPVRVGPELYAVTTIEPDSTSGDLEERQMKSSTAQDTFSESLFWNFPRLARSSGQRGPENEAKLTPGATVVVNFDLNVSPFDIAAATMMHQDFAGLMMSQNANLNQYFGEVVNVHRSSSGQVTAVNIVFECRWFDEYAHVVSFHYHTEGGFYASVHPDRIMAHASFRNIFLTTTLNDLSYELALVWDQVFNLKEDMAFFDKSGERLPVRTPHTIRQLIDGSVSVEIRGKRVPVLDPMSVLPQGFKLW